MTKSLFDELVALMREDAASGLHPAYLMNAPIEPGMTLGELGVDSIGRMALLTALMNLTESHIEDDAFNDGATLGEIVERAAAQASELR